MPKWSFGKIRQRVLVLFVIIVFVLTLFVLTTTGMLNRSLVQDLVEKRALDLVQGQSHIISLWLDERVLELRQLANSSMLESLDWDAIEPYLQRRIAQSPDYFLIYFVATPDGNYNTTSQREAGNISDRDYFPRVMAGETVVSNPMVSRSTNERIIVMATPIWSEDGSSVRGIFGLSVDLVKLLQNSAELTRDSSGMRVYLLDSKGYFILHHDPDQIMHGRMQDTYSNWDLLTQQNSDSVTITQDGWGYRLFFQELGGISDWSVVVEVPTTFFSQPVNRLIFQLILVTVVGLLLVLWLGSWFASTIADPIVELNQIFKQGAQGNLTVRAEVSSTDELGETRSSFNQMMNTIGTMTYYDPLTRLPNRQYFLDSLEKNLLEHASVILALISIRDFSEIKTLVGPEVTDGILVRLAETLKTVSDDSLIMGRTADAEFGMIIPSSITGVLRTIDRLDNLLASPLYFESDDLNVHIFGGISISEGKGLKSDSFYQQAQTALYEAEHSAGDQLKLYNPNTHHAMVDRLRFQAEIRTALDKGQFIPVYQPIVDLNRNMIVGKEALIRWKHPARGLLPPEHFLQVAEHGGFIQEIGEYMLHRVCEQHQVWLDKGLDLGWVAVNISANQFRSLHFPALVQSVLRTYRLPASVLHIEITEDAMLSPTQEVLQNFEELRKMGVHLAIDDFGTAYSTLEYLIRYPVQSLKIDRAFIDRVDVDFRAQGLVRSIVGVGHNLSMAVVAEGVERESQLHLLRTMDCNEAQGYLFSRPLPPDEYLQTTWELKDRLRDNQLAH
ncbi:MAG TPA: hypothetical protein DDZ66_08640 [Firmicutes bacterium]|nr:hypothetical protein [Bacillota bacterium]